MPSTNGHGAEPERVGLYMRVSSEEQKTKDTIETQDGFLEEYCKLYGRKIAKVYKDAAVSGTVPLHERPAGRVLLEDAKAGKFDVVLSTSWIGSVERCLWWWTPTTGSWRRR